MPRPTPRSARPRSSPEQHLTSLYLTLHSCINSSSFSKALQYCDKILRINAVDSLAFQTKIQILIITERFSDALALIESSPDLELQLQHAYCLYKSGKLELASKLTDNERGSELLQAQIEYRLGNYNKSNSIYEELIGAVDTAAPEYEDLETNAGSCSTHLAFLAAAASMASSASATSLQVLESTPLSSLINSHPSLKPTLSKLPTSLSSEVESTATPTTTIDPDRWIPKRERAGYAEELLFKREKERGRRKNKVRETLLTQGSAMDSTKTTPTPSSGGKSGGKKKKGKK